MTFKSFSYSFVYLFISSIIELIEAIKYAKTPTVANKIEVTNTDSTKVVPLVPMSIRVAVAQ